MLASNGGLHQKRVEGGVAAVADAMAERLGDVVRLESEVTHVDHDDTSARLTLAGGEVVEARHVISTLPPRLAVALEHNPPLPQWRIEAADKVAPGNVIKAFLVYKEPFWRDKGFSGQSSADEGAVRVTFDTTSDEANRGHFAERRIDHAFEAAAGAAMLRKGDHLAADERHLDRIDDVATALTERCVRLGRRLWSGGHTLGSPCGGRSRCGLHHCIRNQSQLLGGQHDVRLWRVRIFGVLRRLRLWGRRRGRGMQDLDCICRRHVHIALHHLQRLVPGEGLNQKDIRRLERHAGRTGVAQIVDVQVVNIRALTSTTPGRPQ